jgi:hypothetical protein
MDGFESKARGRCPMSATVKYHICDIALRAGGLEVGTAELVQFATIGV